MSAPTIPPEERADIRGSVPMHDAMRLRLLDALEAAEAKVDELRFKRNEIALVAASAIGERDALQAKIDAVRALHTLDAEGWCVYCTPMYVARRCRYCGELLPEREAAEK